MIWMKVLWIPVLTVSRGIPIQFEIAGQISSVVREILTARDEHAAPRGMGILPMMEHGLEARATLAC